MVRFYLVRHGETEWNAAGRMQGHLDSPLTAVGRQQAARLPEHLAGRGITRIISSDLGRCLATVAPAAAALGLDVETEVRLRERNLGEMQGSTREEWGRKPRGGIDFDFSDPDFVPPGGESLRSVFARSVSAMEELARTGEGPFLIVTHGGVLKCLFHRAIGLPMEMPRRFSVANGALHCVTIEPESNLWELEFWGCTGVPPKAY